MAQPRTKTLFHFTRSAENLYGILRNGFFPRLNLEDASWIRDGNRKTLKSFAFPMVCFCDIPLSRIDDHVGFYGEFGLGLTRNWAVKNALNPVFYVSRESPIGSATFSMLRVVDDADTEEEKRAKRARKEHDAKALDETLHMLAHMKPLSGSIKVSNKVIDKEFYLESEWRYVPQDVRAASTGAFPNKRIPRAFANKRIRSEINEFLKEEARLQFSPSDVAYVFVPKDSDIPPLVSFMNEKMTDHSVADMRILATRITSLETIRRDL
jgi:hypothetical protein